MTKRRERRVSADSDRRNRNTPEPAQTGETDSNRHILRPFILFFFLTVLPLALYRFKYSSSHTNTLLSVYERGLVKPKIAFQQILSENTKVSENTTLRHFTYPVLAYVTPWNSKGYEMAKRFNSKFTHISPVWYELKSEGTKLILEGRHNADVGWISELRTHGHALVLPRVVLEAFPNEMLRKKRQWDKAIDLIITECKDMGYDGIVLESWSRWAAYGILHDAGMRSMVISI